MQSNEYRRRVIQVQNNDLFDKQQTATGKIICANNIKQYIPYGEDVEVSEPIYNALKTAIPTVWKQERRDRRMTSKVRPRFVIIEKSDWKEPVKKDVEIEEPSFEATV